MMPASKTRRKFWDEAVMSTPSAKWSVAYARFGLGARGNAPPPAGDPREAIEAEIGAPGAGRLANPLLPASQRALSAFYDYNAREGETKARAEALRAANAAMPAPQTAALMIPPAADARWEGPPPGADKPPNPVGQVFAEDAAARLEAAAAAPVGFVERLVAFWSNHFCISAAKGGNVRILAGAFEREAIRPFVLAKFGDMLEAVERHPAMLHYLDNAQSVGPDSPAGKNAKRGLNENLAREILELHTLGVDGGYAQADVTEFARVLTGWTVVGREGKLGAPGAFVFNANAHEAGARALIGRQYDDLGFGQGEAVLSDLARSPATARHIATKFARAFVADAPPAPIVARLEAVFLKTDGDLGALARALVSDDDAWRLPATKLRDPWEMVAASVRALGLAPRPPQRYLNFLTLLGMPLWTPGGPNGFPDSAAAWGSPEGLKARLEVAAVLGKLAKDTPAPKELLARVLPDASAETSEAVLRAESRPQAYALLIMAPEFQRR
jgi:uncharacterized protein (DUF1800 family)